MTSGPTAPAASAPAVADGWELLPCVGPRVFGAANGIRFGPDGRLWVCSAFGNALGRLDVETGEVDFISPVGGALASADDIDFDSRGIAYVTEPAHGRVTVLEPSGRTRVLADDLPSANGITVFEDRILVDEARVGGRLLEVFRDGRPHRVILEDLARPNALAVGPDRQIYFPISAGEVWRVPLEGGEPEQVVRGLGLLSSVTYDGDGLLYVSQHTAGILTVIDVRTHEVRRHLHAKTAIDNVAISADGRIYISSFVDGEINEVVADGEVRRVSPPGMVGPYGLCVVGGRLQIADAYSVATPDGEGHVERGIGFATGFHHFARGLAAAADGDIWVAGAGGEVLKWPLPSAPGTPQIAHGSVLSDGFRELMGIAEWTDGSIVVADAGEGVVVAIDPSGRRTTLAGGLRRPSGVAVHAGACYVAESAAGRIVDAADGMRELCGGLTRPEGLAVHDGGLLIVDAGERTLSTLNLATGERQVLAWNLPVGAAPPGVTRKFIPKIPPLVNGPFTPFAGVAVDRDGSIYISGDADGSVLRLRARRG